MGNRSSCRSSNLQRCCPYLNDDFSLACAFLIVAFSDDRGLPSHLTSPAPVAGVAYQKKSGFPQLAS